ncbi:hypothetical protein [Mucilaginibacter sp. 3215]|uniref:hypothetical protein n=1 Tax=Mucilaginibacter sp. 3215 TaxID=3373912 RepID=UPI003D24F8DC
MGKLKSYLKKQRNKLILFLSIQFEKIKSWYIKKWVLSPKWIWLQRIKKNKLPIVHWPKFNRAGTDKLKRLNNNLEKISKISALRLEKDYTDSVIDDLKWIEDSFIKILKLYNTDKELFFTLIDPDNRYRIIQREPIDWESFTFPGFGDVQQVDENQPQQRTYDKLYTVYNNPDRGNDLILRYISSIFNIWNAANQKENFLVQKYSLYVLTNWIFILDPLKDDDFNYQEVLKYFLDNLTNLNISTLNTDTDKIHPLSSLLNYNIYLNRIFSDEVNQDNIDVYFEYLFRNLYQALRLQKIAIVKSFIERCIDSNFYPSNSSNYSTLYSILADKLREHEPGDYSTLLKRLPQLGGYTIRYINNFEELTKWNVEFDEYLRDNIFDKIHSDETILQQVKQIKRLALKTLKFNKLQTVVIKLLAFSLFKKDISILNHALEYNQPGDSNAFQGNKEILPTSLLEILNLIKHRYNIEHELFTYWEGHHGVEFYVDQLFMILLYRYRPQKMYYNEDPKQTAIGFSRDALNNVSGAVDGIDQYIIRLSTMFDKLSEMEPYKSDYFANTEKVTKTKELFAEIHAGFLSVMDNIEIAGNIKDETKTGFISGIISEYEKFNFLLKLYQQYATEPNSEEGLDFETIGVNELMDRTTFVENWHIPYVGFIEGRGRDVAEQENRNGQFEITRKIAPENNIEISENEIVNVLSEYSDDNHIIIIRNVHLDSVLRDEERYKPNWKDDTAEIIIPNFHIGYFDQMPVFRLYDNLFHDSLLIINKSNIITVLQQTGDMTEAFELNRNFKTSFIDLSVNEASLNEMVAQPPIWLAEEFSDKPDGLRSYLRKKIWLRILKKTAFKMKTDSKNYLYEIKE